MSSETAVIGTNDDATTCKYSCVQKGYWTDPYVLFFCKETIKRPPLINRGYYSRVAVINALMREFLKSNGEHKQLVILGAGFDTTYFQLKKANAIEPEDESAGYKRFDIYEVDLPEVVHKKRMIINKQAELKNLISTEWDTQVRSDANGLHSPNYHLMSVDLHSVQKLNDTLVQAGINKSLPTMFISECVLVYLKPEYSDEIVRWSAREFPTSGFATYEQIRPNDPFGMVMMDNLEKRGCPLLGARAYPTLDSQMKRYVSLGWKSCEALDMLDIYNRILDSKEVQR
ncbi:leucine carboxyl methyltransferase 1-like [Planoprotostelium fungivorum]|uniref:Leucine carboxyl methyltransferase 1 n=1 Tax=Planoprotostelium fungivorum TaxID=1890364 RepID=A0A2P6NEW0_9EUKA|nr:leucine carboxyl methyltransferase 1-like [Planoprotostelium fungivorum]